MICSSTSQHTRLHTRITGFTTVHISSMGSGNTIHNLDKMDDAVKSALFQQNSTVWPKQGTDSQDNIPEVLLVVRWKVKAVTTIMFLVCFCCVPVCWLNSCTSTVSVHDTVIFLQLLFTNKSVQPGLTMMCVRIPLLRSCSTDGFWGAKWKSLLNSHQRRNTLLKLSLNSSTYFNPNFFSIRSLNL